MHELVERFACKHMLEGVFVVSPPCKGPPDWGVGGLSRAVDQFKVYVVANTNVRVDG